MRHIDAACVRSEVDKGKVEKSHFSHRPNAMPWQRRSEYPKIGCGGRPGKM